MPPRLLTNADLERMVETTDAWILQRTGIRERHVVDAGVATSDLAAEAAREAIAKAGLRPDRTSSVIVVGTTTPDTIFPSTACLVQHKIGATRAWGFDLGAACSGFTYSLATAAQFIASGMHEHALVIGADVMSSIIDYTDRTTCVLFGDGAGAVVLGPADPDPSAGGIIDFAAEIDGSGGPALCMPAGGSLRPASHETVDQAAPLRPPGRPDRLQVRRPQDRGDLPPAPRAQRPGARRHRPAGVAPGQPPDHPARPPRSSASTRPGSSSTSSASATRPPPPFPWRWPTPWRTADCRPGHLVMLTSVGAGFTVGAVLLRWA